MTVWEGMLQGRVMRKRSTGDPARKCASGCCQGWVSAGPAWLWGWSPAMWSHAWSLKGEKNPLTHCPCKLTFGSVTFRTFFRGREEVQWCWCHGDASDVSGYTTVYPQRCFTLLLPYRGSRQVIDRLCTRFGCWFHGVVQLSQSKILQESTYLMAKNCLLKLKLWEDLADVHRFPLLKSP